MTSLLDKTTEVPGVIMGNLGDLHNRTGNVVRNGAAGALQLFKDGNTGQPVLLAVGPQHMDAVFRALGVDPGEIQVTANDVI